MKIIKYSENIKNKLIELLSNINNLLIEEDVIKNCSILINDNEDIVGLISYEQFGKVGLIRYFIYKKNIDSEYLVQLYQDLEQTLKDEGINKILGIVNSNDIKKIFLKIGFKDINCNDVFFEETVLCKSMYKNSEAYYKLLI